MSPLYKNLFYSCLLLLTACANQESSQIAGQTNMPAVAVTGQPVASVLKEARPDIIESRPGMAGKEKKSEPSRQKDELSIAAGTAFNRSEAPAYAAEMKRKSVGGMDSANPASVASPRVMPYEQQMMPEREQYAALDENPVRQVAEAPVSTFSIDVDTGSYSNVRRMLNAGRLPPADAVRVEEMINYFPYAYALPKGNSAFAVHTEIAPAPWSSRRFLLHIGIKAQDMAKTSLPPSNLVFLVDVSGSMSSPEKLPLLKSALKLLVNQLRPQDSVSLVTYASGTQVVLEPTSGAHKARIVAALENLRAGGSTSGAAGIALAYNMAEQGYIRGGINRILLATDGDFNVGITSFDALKNMAEEKRKGGVSLSTLGFGTGNYNEKLMEQLADAGNGNYSYIDTLNEGQKVLVDEMTSTLATVAKDVKIQIEFNPGVVSEYRLVGYENRMLKREDFNNDRVDAGEVGAGHSVTAIYELTLKGDAGSVDPLRYGKEQESAVNKTAELAFLRLRYKAPDGGVSQLMEGPLHRHNVKASLAQASTEFRFAAAVAAFGQQLRGGKHSGEMKYADIAKLAAEARGADSFGYRGEFLRLVNLAQSLSTQQPAYGVVE
ncbi:MAG: VWA domain-containing protein [Gallionellaceae bacterium]|nr:VWA domain-containing protein [Gallionellaceae bacterium]